MFTFGQLLNYRNTHKKLVAHGWIASHTIKQNGEVYFMFKKEHRLKQVRRDGIIVATWEKKYLLFKPGV